MIALVAALLAVAPADAGAEKDAEIQSAFKAYQSALLEKNGGRCATLVDSATITYYQRMRDLAVTGRAAEIKKLSLMDKVVVVRMRHEIPLAELKAMDGRAMFAYGVAQGWIGDKVAKAQIGAIDVNGDLASGAFMVDGKPTPTRIGLRFERGAWRITVPSLFPAANFVFKQRLKESGTTEDEFVLATVGATAGKPVPATIWDPPTASANVVATAPDAAAVTAAFKAYQTALLRKDGRAGAALLARPTVDYFQRMRDLALAGKAPELKKLTIGDKLTILRLRLEFSAAQLRPLDGRAVLEYSVTHGWVGEEVARIGVGRVEVDGDRATIAALADGKPTSERFSLLREGGAWRLDLVPLFAGANAYFKKARDESGMSEDSFVMMLVEQMAGRPVPVTIWNPPK